MLSWIRGKYSTSQQHRPQTANKSFSEFPLANSCVEIGRVLSEPCPLNYARGVGVHEMVWMGSLVCCIAPGARECTEEQNGEEKIASLLLWALGFTACLFWAQIFHTVLFCGCCLYPWVQTQTSFIVLQGEGQSLRMHLLLVVDDLSHTEISVGSTKQDRNLLCASLRLV